MITFKISEKKTKNSVKENTITRLFEEQDEADEEEQQTILRGGVVPKSSNWLNVTSNPAQSDIDSTVNTENGDETKNCSINDSSGMNESEQKNDEDEKKRQTSNDLNNPHDIIDQPSRKHQKLAGLVSYGKYKDSSEPLPETSSRYISNLISRATRREMEQEIVKERLLKQEMEKEDNEKKPEVFVTGAYKKRLLERQLFEKQMLEQDFKDAINDPKRKKDLTSFHHYMLSSGLGTRSRGGGQ